MAQINTILFLQHRHRAIFLTLAIPRRLPPVLVRASGKVVLKVAQVPSTAMQKRFFAKYLCDKRKSSRDRFYLFTFVKRFKKTEAKQLARKGFCPPI